MRQSNTILWLFDQRAFLFFSPFPPPLSFVVCVCVLGLPLPSLSPFQGSGRCYPLFHRAAQARLTSLPSPPPSP